MVHDDLHVVLKAYLLSLIASEVGDIPKAREYASGLEGLQAPAELQPLSRDFALSLEAEMALAQDNKSEAMRYLQSQTGHALYHFSFASPFVSLSRDRFVRAELLRESERFEEALRFCSSFEEASIYDTVFQAPADLRKGEIYEQMGDAAKAEVHYRRFIDLWSDADDDLQPQVEAARQRLTALSGLG